MPFSGFLFVFDCFLSDFLPISDNILLYSWQICLFSLVFFFLKVYNKLYKIYTLEIGYDYTH